MNRLEPVEAVIAIGFVVVALAALGASVVLFSFLVGAFESIWGAL